MEYIFETVKYIFQWKQWRWVCFTYFLSDKTLHWFFTRMMKKLLPWFCIETALILFILLAFLITLVVTAVRFEWAVPLVLMEMFSVFLLQELLTLEVSAVPRENVFLLKTTVSIWHSQLRMNLGTSKNLSCFLLFLCHCRMLLFKARQVQLLVWCVCYDFINVAHWYMT